jgi:hypothetical protein
VNGGTRLQETTDDLTHLQRLLDESYAAAGAHLRSTFTPQRRSTAADVAAALTGVFVINLATVTARGEPLAAPVDGLFYRGRLWFSLPPGSQRARHLHARPQVSATYLEGDACLIVHGTATEVLDTHPLFAGWNRYVHDAYGIAIDVAKKTYGARREPEFTGFIEPRRIYAQGF